MATASGSRDFGTASERSYITVATRPNIGTADITAIGWFKSSSLAANQTIIGGASIDWDFIETRPNDAGTVYGGTSALEGTSTYSTGQWGFVGMTYDDATPTRTIYFGESDVNAVAQGSDSQTVDATTGTGCAIGILYDGTPDFAMSGDIGNVLLFEAELTAAQMQEAQWNPFFCPVNPWAHWPLFFAGTTSELDISGNGRTGTLTSSGGDPKPLVNVDSPPVGMYAMMAQ